VTNKFAQAWHRITTDPRILCVPCLPADDKDEITEIIRDLRRTAQDLDSLSKVRCLGLAANQLGYDKRIFVIKNPRGKYEAFVNPQIVSKTGPVLSNEICFSRQGHSPGLFLPPIKTSRWVTVTLLDDTGKRRTFTGLKTICVQHEMDHLNGVLI
jgi:peptide deformylase